MVPTDLFIFISLVLWGAWGIFEKRALDFGSPIQIYLGKSIWDLVFFLGVFGYLLYRRKRVRLTGGKMWIFCLASSLCMSVGGITYLAAMGRCSVSYVVGITSCYPVVMYLLALVFLKEEFNRLRLCGILLLVSGLVLIRLT